MNGLNGRYEVINGVITTAVVGVVFITFVDIVILGRSTMIVEGNLPILYLETVGCLLAFFLSCDRLRRDLDAYSMSKLISCSWVACGNNADGICMLDCVDKIVECKRQMREGYGGNV